MELYRKLYKTLPLPVLLLQKKQGHYIIKDFNQSYLDLAAQKDENLVGQNLSEMLTALLASEEHNMAQINALLAASATDGKPAETEITTTRLGTNNGNSEITWIVEFIPILEDDLIESESGMMVFRRDAMQNKTLQEKEERYRSIFENSLDAVLFTVPDGRILAANPEACKMFQMTEEELCTVGREGIVDTTDPRFSEALTMRRKTGKAKVELTYVRKDSSKFPVEVASSIFRNSRGEERTCIIIRDVTHQKRVEEELKKSREKYRLLFEYNPLPNWIYDNETLRITEVNLAAVQQYGYSREDFLQLKITDLRPKEEVSDFLALIKDEKSKEGVVHFGKVNHLKKDRSPKMTDIWAYRFKKSNSTLVISQDLSKWEEIQKELKDKSEKLLIAEKMARMGYWEFDFIKNSHYWTDEVYNIWERNKDSFELGIQAFFNTVHPDDLEALKQEQDLALSGKKEMDIEHRILLPGGKIKWVHEKGRVLLNDEGKPVGFHGSVQDITEYKTALENLRISEARQASLLQSQTNYLIRTDLNGNYTYCNEKFHQDFSWVFPDNKILGKSARATFKNYHHEKAEAIFKKCISTPNRVHQIEIDKVQQGGDVKTSLWDVICVTNSKGEPMEVQGVGIDITNRVKAEKDVKEINRRYELVTKATSDAIWDWDSETNSLFLGEGFRDLFGHKIDRLSHNANFWCRYIHPEDAPKIIQDITSVLEGASDFWEAEYRFRKANGEYAFVKDRSYITRDESGKALRMVGAMQDVTQQRRSIEKLVQSETRYRGLVQSQTNYFIRVDHNGNYSYCNDKYLKDFGWLYEDRNVIGSNSLKSVAEYHHERVIHTTQECIAHPDEVFQVELDKPERNGGIKTTLWDFTILPGSDNQKVEMQCMGIDITDRVKAEQEIKFQAKLLNTIGQAAIATNPEGKVTYWNSAAEKMYGWHREEAIGKNIMDLTPSRQSRQQAAEIMQNLLKGISWSGEFTVRRKDGTEFPAFVTDAPLLDKDGNLTGIIGISSDITESKKLKELLETATNLSRIGSYEIDSRTNEIYWSPVTREIHEVDDDFTPSFEEVISFYNDEDQKKILLAYFKAATNNTEFDVEAQITTHAGNLRWVRLIGQPLFENGTCTKLTGSFQDIDKVKKAELEVLRASEEKEKLLESIGDAFFALDHDWAVTFWNSEAEKVLECSKEEMLGKKLVDVFDIKNTPFEKYYRKAIEENKTQHFEAFFEGTQSWYEVNAYPSPDGLSVFFKDVTDQKDTNFKLKELNKNLQTYADELATANKGLEQFSYIISHNLRAPVANILGLADLLESEEYPQEVRKEILSGIVGNVRRLDKVMYDLNQILQVKNEFSQSRETINLEELVFSIKSSLQNLVIEEQVEIRTNFNACDEVTTIPGYLYSIFYNLIFNSIKYRRTGTNPIIEIVSKIKEDKLYFLFKDNGMGIDLERKGDQVFGLYKRFHHHVEGKGIGLFMVKTQVEMLGGRISISSEPNKGTVFTIEWNVNSMNQRTINDTVYSS